MGDERDKPVEDEEESDFEDRTEAGGWWSADQDDRRADPRAAFNATVEAVPSDGKIHECEGVNLSLGGALLHKTNRGELPSLGQMLVVQIRGHADALDALVVRVQPVDGRFAIQFVNLAPEQRTYLAGQVDGTGDAVDSDTAYVEVKKKD